jgi:proteasome activator subunit 4
LASSTLAGLMKGAGSKLAEVFRKESLEAAVSLQAATKLKTRREPSSLSTMPQRHGVILGVAACVLSVPYDMPGWLPEMVTVLARFHQESWPIRGTVTKTVSEFRRTHLDTWEFQQDSFTEEQLEVLSDLTSAASYFA